MKTTALVLGLAAWLTPTLALADMMSVSSQTANFRAGPSQKDKVLFSADLYYPVHVVEKKGAWTKVRDFEGEAAWVTSQHLVAKPTVVIKADKANIREKANTESDVLFQVERGEVFKVVDRKGNWVSVIDANKDGGWIRADMTWGLDEPKEDAASGDEEDAKPKAAEPKAAEPKAAEPKTECTCVKKGNEVARAEKSDAKAEKTEKVEPKAEKVAEKSDDADAEPAAEKSEPKADKTEKAEKAKPEKVATHDKAEKAHKAEKAKPEKAQKASSDKKKASTEKHANKKK